LKEYVARDLTTKVCFRQRAGRTRKNRCYFWPIAICHCSARFSYLFQTLKNS